MNNKKYCSYIYTHLNKLSLRVLVAQCLRVEAKPWIRSNQDLRLSLFISCFYKKHYPALFCLIFKVITYSYNHETKWWIIYSYFHFELIISTIKIFQKYEQYSECFDDIIPVDSKIDHGDCPGVSVFFFPPWSAFSRILSA